MSSYVASSAAIQQQHQVFLAEVRKWLQSRMVARREAKAKRLNLAFLRGLDRGTLQDVGIDPDALPPLHPSLSSQHAAAVAVTLFSNRPEIEKRW